MISRKLFDIITSDASFEIKGDVQVSMNGFELDSRKVSEGNAFVALKGANVDGHDFIANAVKAKASVVFCEQMPSDVSPEVTYVASPNLKGKLPDLVSRFYDNPSKGLKLIGVTGTNGKSTIAVLLYQLFTELGFKCGLISTIQYAFGSIVESASHTTPSIVKTNQILRQMCDYGCEFAIMEVSSHGIDQGRIEGLHFERAVFTNLSHDHLDYHKTYKEYVYTKKKFFDVLPVNAKSIINIDDKQGELMVQNTKSSVLRYSLTKMADYKAKLLSNGLAGLHLVFNGREFYAKLRAKYNAYNLLAVFAVADSYGLNVDELLIGLSQLPGAEGRFDTISSAVSGKFGIVDYAHTPDAVKNLLSNVRQMADKKSRLIAILGCGGDRDKTKRPKMANVGTYLSDVLILTSDNPRTESPEAILDDMEEGVTAEMEEKVLRIADRRQAIKTAVKMAKHGDIIIVAGKGHEKYQDINGKKLPFDDKEILKSYLDG